MSVWASVWTRPGHATYGQKIGQLPADGGVTVGFSGVGAGNLTLPREYSRLSEILSLDTVTPANGDWSTIRVFSENGWLYDWLPTPRNLPPDKNTPGINISGFGIEGVLGFARVEPWDWDGSVNFASTFPDWIYGGRNLLSNPGFEESPCRPEVEEIVLASTVSGGTFDLGDGIDTTTLAWNASAFDIETALEADIAAIDDVNVSGAGTEADPWVIEFVNPCVFAGGLIFDPSNLTPAPSTSSLTRVQFGALQPNPWTKSQEVSTGTPRIYGEYTSFRVTTAQAHTGTYSLLIDPAPIGRRFAGAQQVLNVEPGGVYQASVWVYTASASQEYRLVIRGIDGDLLTTPTGNALVQATPAANTWTQLSIADVNVGDNAQIIFRISNINVSGNPAIFYVDDGEFNEGQAPNTVGFIFRELYEDATIDHAGRVVWEDEANPGSSYLSLDFDDALDSDGAAWADTLSITFKPRMTYLHVMEQFSRLGYEWRIVPDSIIAGTYLLQIYNAGTLGGIVAAGIVAGSSDIVRDARLLAPKATDIMVQAADNLYSHDNDAGAQSAFGRIEGSVLDQNLTSLTDAALVASDSLDAAVSGSESLVYTLRNPNMEPLIDYRPGDEITLADPGVVSGARRVAQIILAWDKTGPEYTVSLGSVFLTGQAAVNQAVDEILARFQRPEPLPGNASVSVGGGGGAPTVVLSTISSTSMSQSKADFICDGNNDASNLQAAIDICTNIGGRILFTEGIFDFGGALFVIPDTNDPIYFEGAGKRATFLQWTDIITVDFLTIKRGGFRNLQIRQTPGG